MRLHEEEYNQIVKIGRFGDKRKALIAVEKIKNLGVYAYSEGPEVFVSIEQDRNDPHYVDDVVSICRNMFKSNTNDFGKYKLAESEFKWVCDETIKCLMNESYFNNTMYATAKSQLLKMANNKIRLMFLYNRRGDNFEPETKFENAIYRVCQENNFISKRTILDKISKAINKIMIGGCKNTNMSQHDMLSYVNNTIEDYI